MTVTRLAPRRRHARLLPGLALGAMLAASLNGLLAAPVAASVVPGRLTDGGATAGAPSAASIRLTRVADVPQPVLAIGAHDGTNRLFIVSKGGTIRIVKNGTLLPTPFLDISSLVSKGSEQGLLGLAFHPDYRTNRKLYVNYTNTSGTTVIREYRASAGNPDVPQPVLAIGAHDGTNRLFIVSKGGTIRIVKNGTLLPTPFLDISSLVSKGSEQGLLGLAFHPDYRTNRKLYVNYTNTSGTTVIREYRASAGNPDVVATSTARTILTIKQPYANHNGGMLAFSKGGYLFIGMGDGGSAGDPGNRAQSLSSLLGKMLRIDINGTTSTHNYRVPSTNPYVGRTGRNEIWQRGLRNPWRFSFDRLTGNLWIADVGQDRYEEVDRAIKTSSGPGKAVNWGWRVMEGRHCYNPATGCNRTGKTLPLTEYSHAANGRCAITGGYVYRGSAIAALRGWYVYGDYCSGEVWAVSSTAAAPATPVRLVGTGTGRLVSGFGEDNAGALYLCDLNGTVYRIDPS